MLSNSMIELFICALCESNFLAISVLINRVSLLSRSSCFSLEFKPVCECIVLKLITFGWNLKHTRSRNSNRITGDPDEIDLIESMTAIDLYLQTVLASFDQRT